MKKKNVPVPSNIYPKSPIAAAPAASQNVPLPLTTKGVKGEERMKTKRKKHLHGITDALFSKKISENLKTDTHLEPGEIPKTAEANREQQKSKPTEHDLQKLAQWLTAEKQLAEKVAVVNLKNGVRLTGEAAPTKKNVEIWLDQHPGYMIDSQDAPLMTDVNKKRTRNRPPRVEPPLENVNCQSAGCENVSVVNRVTGKQISGSKAPTLKLLPQWLDRNPEFDVERGWAHVVRKKGNLPDRLRKRIQESKRGSRSRTSTSVAGGSSSSGKSSSISSSSIFPSSSTLSSLANPALLSAAGFPSMKFLGLDGVASSKNMQLPFSGMPFGGLPYPFLSSLNQMPGLIPSDVSQSPSTSTLSSTSSTGSNKYSFSSSAPGTTTSSAVADSTAAVAAAIAAAAASMPPLSGIFPPSLIYNPMLSPQLGKFALPTSMPTSFASLAQSGLFNGLGVSTTTAKSTSSTTPSSSRKRSSHSLSSHSSTYKSIESIDNRTQALLEQLAQKHAAMALAGASDTGGLPKTKSASKSCERRGSRASAGNGVHAKSKYLNTDDPVEKMIVEALEKSTECRDKVAAALSETSPLNLSDRKSKQDAVAKPANESGTPTIKKGVV